MDLIRQNFKKDIIKIIENNAGIKKFKIKEFLELENESKPINNLFEKDFEELLKEGIIRKDNKHRLSLNIEDFFIGKIHFSTQGSAFVTDEEGTIYFIPKTDVLNSLNEDLVVCIPTRERTFKKKPEAKVVTVLERTLKKLVGIVCEKSENYLFVTADNEKIHRDFYIPISQSNNADLYEKVVINITKYPSLVKSGGIVSVKNPEAEVLEVIGFINEKGVDTLSVVKENDIRDDFPADVKREASEISLKLEEDEINRRTDFRDKIIFTIDGEDAKDLDDAISIEKTSNGYELGVHIADVSHYVKENSEIDKEAFLRGTSIYLVERVIPMLPKILSNNLCSLNPNEDKLTLSCIMNFDNDGNLLNSKIVESVINSNARLNYTEVSNYINGIDTTFEERHPGISDNIKLATELSSKLMEKRINRGSIEFDFEETKITVDEDGVVTDIGPYHRDISNDIIEEFMLAANETVAKTFCDAKIPFVYRIHDYPREEKFENFKRIASLYGIENTFDDVTPKSIAEFIEENKENDNIEPLKMLLLQSMQQARYSNLCSLHFGLASNYYCHFTSPIRRYPDLQIHRIIKLYINGMFNEVLKEKYEKITEEVSAHCSKTERTADIAERELDKLKIADYMMRHAGQEFEGKIKNFNKVGMYILLNNTTEGFVRPIGYSFDENTYTANYKGREVKLGEKVTCSPIAIGKNKEIVLDILKFHEE